MGAIVASEAGGRRTVQAFLDGFERALIVAAVIAFAGAIVAAVLVRMHATEEQPTAAVQEIAA